MISTFFINRPIVAMVIAILTVIVGLIAMRSLPLAQLPEIVPPQINVSTTYTGADAVTIEQSVSTPLEQQMNGVDNMLYMQSTNANDGTEQLTVTFDVDTNVNNDQVNVQNRVAQAQPNLPTDVTQFGLTIRKSTGVPMIVVALYSPKQTYQTLFLANYANININDALYRVPGVGEVRVFGASDYAMRIWIKPDVLSKLGLSVPDLANAVKAQSTVNPSGQVGAEPMPAGTEKTYTVRAQGRLQTPEEFGQIVVRSNPDGSVVRLKDVARIELGAQNYQQSSRMNGQPSTIIAVFQAPGSNALAVADGVKKTMEELKGRFPSDLDYAVVLDTTLPVTEGIYEIVVTLVEAMILVAIAVILASIFLPVAFIGGVQGRLNNQFAVTIAISMLISAFNALTLSPALAALLLRPRKESRGILGRFFGGFNRTFEKVMQYYLGWSRGLIRKAIIAVLILIAFMALDGLLGKRLPTSFLPEEDYGYAFLNVQLPAAASLSRTDEVLRKIEKIIARNEGVQYTTTVGGFSLLTRTSASYQGFFFLGLKPWGERKSKQLQARAIVDSLNGQLMTQVPEAIAFAF